MVTRTRSFRKARARVCVCVCKCVGGNACMCTRHTLTCSVLDQFFFHVRLIRDESATRIRIKKQPPNRPSSGLSADRDQKKASPTSTLHQNGEHFDSTASCESGTTFPQHLSSAIEDRGPISRLATGRLLLGQQKARHKKARAKRNTKTCTDASKQSLYCRV